MSLFEKYNYLVCYFFFFQAEDGIRDYKVTGVQTCALPISDFERVRMAVNDRVASNVRLHGPMLWEEAIHWYSKSDVLYTQLSPAFSTAMPSKLYEYLATG